MGALEAKTLEQVRDNFVHLCPCEDTSFSVEYLFSRSHLESDDATVFDVRCESAEVTVIISSLIHTSNICLQ